MSKYGTTVNRFQMHCPACGHEFVWDLSPIDREQEELKQQMKDVETRIQEMRMEHSPEALGYNRKYRELRAKAAQIHEQLTRIKQVKKNNHEITAQIWQLELKEAIKDRYGLQAYEELVEIVKDRLKPERLEKLMKEKP